MKRFAVVSTMIVLLACLAPLSAICAQTMSGAEKLDRYFDAMVARDRMMLSIELARKGEVLYRYQGGFASVENQQPLTEQSRFRIGSITKTFTAVMVLQLVEEGLIGLDAGLERYFPAVQNASGITIKQLLSHRSGIANFTNAPEYPGYMTEAQPRKQVIERIAALEPEFEPGSRYGYSNSNYFLLGAIIEDVTEKDYATLLAERITRPLGLGATYYGGPIDPENNEALSYRWLDGGWKIAPQTDMSIPGGAGAIVSTPADLNRFFHALFSGELVNEQSVSKMRDLQDNYGLGLIAFPFYEHRFLGHNGGIDGFLSTAAYNPEDGTGIAVLSNGQNANFNDVLVAALSAVYGRDFEVPDFSARPVGLERDLLESLTGNYSSQQISLDIRVFLEGAQLMAQAAGQGAFPLTPYSTDEFRFEQAGIVIEFDRATDPVSFTLHQAGGRYAFERVD